jgi:hypothetical protein
MKRSGYILETEEKRKQEEEAAKDPSLAKKF